MKKIEKVKVKKQGGYVRVYAKFGHAATLNLKTLQMSGLTKYFEYLDPYMMEATKIQNDKVRQLAADLIDLVESAIRDAHPEIEKIASSWKPEDPDVTEPPNTLLYGEGYYDLEDQITQKLREVS